MLGPPVKTSNTKWRKAAFMGAAFLGASIRSAEGYGPGARLVPRSRGTSVRGLPGLHGAPQSTFIASKPSKAAAKVTRTKAKMLGSLGAPDIGQTLIQVWAIMSGIEAARVTLGSIGSPNQLSLSSGVKLFAFFLTAPVWIPLSFVYAVITGQLWR